MYLLSSLYRSCACDFTSPLHISNLQHYTSLKIDQRTIKKSHRVHNKPWFCTHRHEHDEHEPDVALAAAEYHGLQRDVRLVFETTQKIDGRSSRTGFRRLWSLQYLLKLHIFLSIIGNRRPQLIEYFLLKFGGIFPTVIKILHSLGEKYDKFFKDFLEWPTGIWASCRIQTVRQDLISFFKLCRPLGIVGEISLPTFSNPSNFELGPNPVFFQHILPPQKEFTMTRVGYVSMELLEYRCSDNSIVTVEQRDFEDVDMDAELGNFERFETGEDGNFASSPKIMDFEATENTTATITRKNRIIEITDFSGEEANANSTTAKLALRPSNETTKVVPALTCCGKVLRTQGEKKYVP